MRKKRREQKDPSEISRSYNGSYKDCSFPEYVAVLFEKVCRHFGGTFCVVTQIILQSQRRNALHSFILFVNFKPDCTASHSRKWYPYSSRNLLLCTQNLSCRWLVQRNQTEQNIDPKHQIIKALQLSYTSRKSLEDAWKEEEEESKVRGKVAHLLNQLSTRPWRSLGNLMYRSTFSCPWHWLEVKCQLHVLPSYSLGRESPDPWDRKMGGPDSMYGRMEKWKLLTYRDLNSNPSVGQPAANRYTDCATTALTEKIQ
jgi:hypothetical protein